MGKRVEKIDSWYSRGWRGAKFVKKQTSRTLRRMAKRDPENAPRRLRDITRGWTS